MDGLMDGSMPFGARGGAGGGEKVDEPSGRVYGTEIFVEIAVK